MTNWPPPRLRFAKSWPNGRAKLAARGVASKKSPAGRKGIRSPSSGRTFCMPPIVSGGFRDDFPNRAARQAFRLGEVLDASAVALRRPPIGRPDFLSGLPPRRGAGSVGRYAPTPTDWATRFFVRPSAPARCWERRPLRPDAHRLGDLIFRQAFRTTALRTAIPSRARKTTPTTIEAMSEIRALRR